MSYKNKRRDRNTYDMNSFRARSAKNQARRNKIRKKRILTLCTCIVFIVILAASVVKIRNIDKSDDKKNIADNNISSTVKPESTPTPTPEPTPTPTPEPEGKDMWLRKDLDPDKPMVALTFDDGPYRPVTEKLLKILEKYDARATFFTVGSRISTYESTVKKAYEQGNQIASHTYNHVYLTQLSKSKIKKELSKSNKAIKKAIGCGFDALRPPGGMVNDRMKKAINVPMYYWSVDTEDWKSRDAASVLSRCKSIQDGDIVLMHDLYPSTAKAVKKLVPRLVKEGYQLVTIDELFYYKGIETKGGVLYFDAIKKQK